MWIRQATRCNRLTVVLLAIAVFCGACAAPQPEQPTLAAGDIPPDYLGKTAAGKPVHLSELRGDVVVISFWATWCHYCMKELPVLAGLQSVATERGLRMQVVAVNYREPRHTFAQASDILTSRLPNLVVTRDYDGDLGEQYGVRALPFMVMLHRNGTVAYIHIGYNESELDTILAEINTLLNEPETVPIQTTSR
ncbi:MAG: TlpA family protein disulfide reductase [Gammaproteobacteria bacterium]|nr:TlpA family protein disulfide reductase [Gammaproteobacteria bacterium]